jgi:hypothetical protein
MKVPSRLLASIVAVTAIGLAALACDESQPVAPTVEPTETESFGSVTQQLITDVELLVDAGKLPAAVGKSLCSEIEAAYAAFYEGDMSAASANVHAFQSVVSELLISGALPTFDCTCLILSAEELLQFIRKADQ